MSMTPKERAAMQQALDFIDYFVFNGDNATKAKSISTALREALDHSGEANEMVAEQAEQEPVAWVWLDDWLNDGYPEDCFSRVNHQNKTPLYTAPVRTKDLTDDEIWDALASTGFGASCYEDARAVIAADREKNK